MANRQSAIEVAFFDIDATLYRDNFSLRLIQVLSERGHLHPDQCANLDIVMARWRAREASYDAVNAEISRITDTAFEGLYLDDLIEAGKIAAAHGISRPYLFTRALLDALKGQKRPPRLVAISGSPIAVVEPYCQSLGFHEVHATLFKLEDGRVTGGFSKATSPYHRKDKTVYKVAKKMGLENDYGCVLKALAVGDAFADSRMLAAVEYPIAFNPTRALYDECRKRGYPAVYERKDNVTVSRVPWPHTTKSLFTEVRLDSIVPKQLAAKMAKALK